MDLVVPVSILVEMQQLAGLRAPREACGVVFGKTGTDVVVRMVEMRNIAEHEQDFAFDPVQQLDVWRAGEQDGLVPLVLWHSHPRAEAYPSPPDQACMALHQNLHHVVVDGSGHPRAFRWDNGVVEVGITTPARPVSSQSPR